MPKKTRKKSAPKKTARSNRSQQDPLVQVRDLLFGRELTEQKKRTHSAELRLQQKVEKQSGVLAERVTKLSTRLTKAKQGLEESVEELKRENAQAQKELKRDFTAALKSLQAETAQMLARVEGRMLAVLEDVRDSQADRATLASMFEDFAKRVGGAKSKKKK